MTSLDERIEGEMVADSISLLEDQFDRAVKIVKILDDGTIELRDPYRDLPPKESMLGYLIGQCYAAQTDRVDTESLPYQFFYTRFDVDDSHVRRIANELEDDALVETAETQSDKRLVAENITRAIDHIEDAVG